MGHSCDPTNGAMTINDFVERALKCEDKLGLCEESSLNPGNPALRHDLNNDWSINSNGKSFSLGFRESAGNRVIPDNYICAYDIEAAPGIPDKNYGMRVSGSNEKIYMSFRENHAKSFFYDNAAIARQNNAEHTLLIPPNDGAKVVFVNHIVRTAESARNFQIDFNYMTESQWASAYFTQFGNYYGNQIDKAATSIYHTIVLVVVIIILCCICICVCAIKGCLSCCAGGRRSDDDYVEVREAYV